MENGGAGLEGLAGDVDRRHAPPDDAVSLEHSDCEVESGRGILAEEVCHGGAADAGADDADCVMSLRKCC